VDLKAQWKVQVQMQNNHILRNVDCAFIAWGSVALDPQGCAFAYFLDSAVDFVSCIVLIATVDGGHGNRCVWMRVMVRLGVNVQILAVPAQL